MDTSTIFNHKHSGSLVQICDGMNSILDLNKSKLKMGTKQTIAKDDRSRYYNSFGHYNTIKVVDTSFMSIPVYQVLVDDFKLDQVDFISCKKKKNKNKKHHSTLKSLSIWKRLWKNYFKK